MQTLWLILVARRARSSNVRERSKMSVQREGRRPCGASPRDVDASAVRTHLPVVENHGRDITEKLQSICTCRSLFQTHKCGFIVRSLGKELRPLAKVVPSLTLSLVWLCRCVGTVSGNGPKLRHPLRNLNSDRFQIFFLFCPFYPGILSDFYDF